MPNYPPGYPIPDRPAPTPPPGPGRPSSYRPHPQSRAPEPRDGSIGALRATFLMAGFRAFGGKRAVRSWADEAVQTGQIEPAAYHWLCRQLIEVPRKA